MVHELKTVQPYFENVYLGKKRFEFRFNDRDYKPKDILVLKEYDSKRKKYSGRMVIAVVTYMMNGNNEILNLGNYVIMSFDILHIS